MKKIASLLCLIIAFAVFAGCGPRSVEQEYESHTVMIGNPWTDWDLLAEAEAAVGFSFGLPEVMADGYEIVSIRTMNNELLEVVYRYEELEVCVRKQKGEGQDISGDYNVYEICEETDYYGAVITNYLNSVDPAAKQIISYHGYSWSLVAPNGYGVDLEREVLNWILKQ